MGIVGLIRAMARLGWIAGPIVMVSFYIITLITNYFQITLYEVRPSHRARTCTIQGHISPYLACNPESFPTSYSTPLRRLTERNTADTTWS